jgi:N-succinyldiaminopimelate aminotransferase
LNPLLSRLQPYPFEKLRLLFEGVRPNAAYKPIALHIGEPKHPTPELIKRALTDSLDSLAAYPATAGTPALREVIAAWIGRRYGIPAPDAVRQILPINGSREALFALAQVVIGTTSGDKSPVVVCPNPFYQIYEGAALLAGAEPYFVNADPTRAFAEDYASVPDDVWSRTQLLYLCSPGNPSGRVMTQAEWKLLFDLSERHDFVIASDECYSELYFDESRPPLGALQAAHALGRRDYARLVVFSSLSKRSNVPGMRSGFVAGDARLLEAFLLYRTYHGSAMSPAVQAASIAAWGDEAHVRENRDMYRAKFSAVLPLIRAPLRTTMPEAGFYFWVRTPMDDAAFARDFLAAYNVSTLPGSYLARDARGVNPGLNHVRLALVAPLAECVEAANRLAEFSAKL